MLLKVEDLDVYYGHIHAVKGVSFTIESNEIVALVGSNGAGKSSTIKALCGLVKPRRGKITFAENEITGVKSERIVNAGIGYVPEGRRIFPQMSVLENLMIGAYARRDKSTLAHELETIYGYFPILAQRRNQLAAGLSGGEQQMLALGRALMTRPRLLVLDEPSLGLAPIIVKQVFALLQRLNREEGLAILLVEQNAYAALRIAHQGIVLETGRVRLRGKASDMVKDPEVQALYLGSNEDMLVGKASPPIDTSTLLQNNVLDADTNGTINHSA
jgi:branched-chain amino acid transport system ATP-binding protein